MPAYLVSQIKLGKIKYQEVIEKYPQYKEDIDRIFRDQGLDPNEFK